MSGAYDTLGSQAFGSGNKVSNANLRAEKLNIVFHLDSSFISAGYPAEHLQVLVMSWAITASFAMLLVNVPVSIGMWHAGDAARVLFQQVPSFHTIL